VKFAGRHLAPVTLVAVVGCWELAARLDWASDRVLAAPTEIAAAFVALLGRGYFYEHLWATARVVMIGTLASVAIGLSLAVLVSINTVVRNGVYPFVAALNIIPKVALIPLITIVFGFGDSSRILIVVMAAFFPVFLNTLSGLAEVDLAGRRLLTSLGASRLQHLRYHEIPSGLPAIFAGIKTSVTIAFIAAVVAEYLIRDSGLAYLITVFRAALNIQMTYAVTISIGLVGALAFLAVDRLERRVVFWVDLEADTYNRPGGAA
jgi:NitT/TauT family transport system permease protein